MYTVCASSVYLAITSCTGVYTALLYVVGMARNRRYT